MKRNSKTLFACITILSASSAFAAESTPTIKWRTLYDSRDVFSQELNSDSIEFGVADEPKDKIPSVRPVVSIRERQIQFYVDQYQDDPSSIPSKPSKLQQAALERLAKGK